MKKTNNRLTELKEDLTAEMDQIDSAEYIEQQARKELKDDKERRDTFPRIG